MVSARPSPSTSPWAARSSWNRRKASLRPDFSMRIHSYYRPGTEWAAPLGEGRQQQAGRARALLRRPPPGPDQEHARQRDQEHDRQARELPEPMVARADHQAEEFQGGHQRGPWRRGRGNVGRMLIAQEIE